MSALDDLRKRYPSAANLSDSDIIERVSAASGLDPQEVAASYGITVNDPGFATTVKRSLGQLVGGVGEVYGDISGNRNNALSNYAEDVEFRNPSGINSLADVADKPWLAVKEATGNAATFLLPGAGLKIAGGLARGAKAMNMARAIDNPVTQAAVAGLPSLGEIGDMQRESGLPEDFGAKYLGGMAVGAIENLGGVQRMMGFGRAPQVLSKADEVAMFGKTPLRTMGKTMLRSGLEEGAEEIPQTFIEKGAGFQDPFSAQNLEEAALGGVLGAIGGGVLGGGVGALRGMRHAAINKERSTDLLNPDTPLSRLEDQAQWNRAFIERDEGAAAGQQYYDMRQRQIDDYIESLARENLMVQEEEAYKRSLLTADALNEHFGIGQKTKGLPTKKEVSSAYAQKLPEPIWVSLDDGSPAMLQTVGDLYDYNNGNFGKSFSNAGFFQGVTAPQSVGDAVAIVQLAQREAAEGRPPAEGTEFFAAFQQANQILATAGVKVPAYIPPTTAQTTAQTTAPAAKKGKEPTTNAPLTRGQKWRLDTGVKRQDQKIDRFLDAIDEQLAGGVITQDEHTQFANDLATVWKQSGRQVQAAHNALSKQFADTIKARAQTTPTNVHQTAQVAVGDEVSFVNNLMKSIPDKARRVLELYSFDKQPFEEIGVTLANEEGRNKPYTRARMEQLHAEAVGIIKAEAKKLGVPEERIDAYFGSENNRLQGGADVQTYSMAEVAQSGSSMHTPGEVNRQVDETGSDEVEIEELSGELPDTADVENFDRDVANDERVGPAEEGASFDYDEYAGWNIDAMPDGEPITPKDVDAAMAWWSDAEVVPLAGVLKAAFVNLYLLQDRGIINARTFGEHYAKISIDNQSLASESTSNAGAGTGAAAVSGAKENARVPETGSQGSQAGASKPKVRVRKRAGAETAEQLTKDTAKLESALSDFMSGKTESAVTVLEVLGGSNGKQLLAKIKSDFGMPASVTTPKAALEYLGGPSAAEFSRSLPKPDSFSQQLKAQVGSGSTLTSLSPVEGVVRQRVLMVVHSLQRRGWNFDKLAGFMVADDTATDWDAAVITESGEYYVVLNQAMLDGKTTKTLEETLHHELAHVLDDSRSQRIHSGTSDFKALVKDLRDRWVAGDKNVDKLFHYPFAYTNAATSAAREAAIAEKEVFAQLMAAYVQTPELVKEISNDLYQIAQQAEIQSRLASTAGARTNGSAVQSRGRSGNQPSQRTATATASGKLDRGERIDDAEVTDSEINALLAILADAQVRRGRSDAAAKADKVDFSASNLAKNVGWNKDRLKSEFINTFYEHIKQLGTNMAGVLRFVKDTISLFQRTRAFAEYLPDFFRPASAEVSAKRVLAQLPELTFERIVRDDIGYEEEQARRDPKRAAKMLQNYVNDRRGNALAELAMKLFGKTDTQRVRFNRSGMTDISPEARLLFLKTASKYTVAGDRLVEMRKDNEHPPIERVNSRMLRTFAALVKQGVSPKNAFRDAYVSVALAPRLDYLRSILGPDMTGWIRFSYANTDGSTQMKREMAGNLQLVTADTWGYGANEGRWCIGQNATYGDGYLSRGDFYIYVEKGATLVSARVEGKQVVEWSGLGSGQQVRREHQYLLAELGQANPDIDTSSYETKAGVAPNNIKNLETAETLAYDAKDIINGDHTNLDRFLRTVRQMSQADRADPNNWDGTVNAVEAVVDGQHTTALATFLGVPNAKLVSMLGIVSELAVPRTGQIRSISLVDLGFPPESFSVQPRHAGPRPGIATKFWNMGGLLDPVVHGRAEVADYVHVVAMTTADKADKWHEKNADENGVMPMDTAAELVRQAEREINLSAGRAGAVTFSLPRATRDALIHQITHSGGQRIHPMLAGSPVAIVKTPESPKTKAVLEHLGVTAEEFSKRLDAYLDKKQDSVEALVRKGIAATFPSSEQRAKIGRHSYIGLVHDVATSIFTSAVYGDSHAEVARKLLETDHSGDEGYYLGRVLPEDPATPVRRMYVTNGDLKLLAAGKTIPESLASDLGWLDSVFESEVDGTVVGTAVPPPEDGFDDIQFSRSGKAQHYVFPHVDAEFSEDADVLYNFYKKSSAGRLMEYVGISVVSGPGYGLEDGEGVYRPDNKTILIRNDVPSSSGNMLRWVLAHELGHAAEDLFGAQGNSGLEVSGIGQTREVSMRTNATGSPIVFIGRIAREMRDLHRSSSSSPGLRSILDYPLQTIYPSGDVVDSDSEHRNMRATAELFAQLFALRVGYNTNTTTADTGYYYSEWLEIESKKPTVAAWVEGVLNVIERKAEESYEPSAGYRAELVSPRDAEKASGAPAAPYPSGPRRNAPEVARSETAQDTFDFSRSYAANPSPENFFGTIREKLEDLAVNPTGWAKEIGVGLLHLDHMADVLDSAAIREYNDVMVAMQKDSKEWIARAAKIVNQWDKLSELQNTILSDVMRSSTRASFDPSKKTAPADEEQRRILREYNKLDDKAKAMYAEVRDYYASQFEERKKIMLALAKKAGKNSELEVERAFAKVAGPYFPLGRIGNWYAVGMSDRVAALNDKAERGEISAAERKELERLRKDPKHYKTSTVTSRRLAKQKAAEFAAEFGEKNAFYNVAAERIGQEINQMPDVARINEYIATELPPEARSKVKDMLAQMYFDMLPEHSDLKRRMKREGIHGEETNMRQVFAATAISGAHHTSRLKHADPLSEAMVKVRKEGRRDETRRMAEKNLAKRAALAMQTDEHPVVDKLMQASYFAHLGLSPAFLLTNLTQTPMIAAPWLGARHGYGATMRALASAFADTKDIIGTSLAGDVWLPEFNWQSKFKEDTPEGRLFRDLTDRNLLDITMEYDLGTVAKVGNETADRIIQRTNMPVRATEFVNRSMTALAAYRLARVKYGNNLSGEELHKKAVEHAAAALSNTQFNYSALNRPLMMQSVLGSKALARIVSQFRGFQLNMAYLLIKSAYDAVKGDSLEKRTEAMRTLLGIFGTTGLMAGAIGLPGFATVAMIGNMIGGLFAADDDPWDTEEELRKWLADVFGPEVGRAVAKGLPTLIGLDLSKRVGLGDVFSPLPFMRQGKSGPETVANTLAAIGGAPIGTIADTLDGIGLLADGQFVKGAEKVVPLKLAKDLLRGSRYATEGMTDKQGDVILAPDKFSPWDITLRGMGFQPTLEAEYYAGNQAMQRSKMAVEDTRRKLLGDYARAKIAGEDVTDIEQDIREFNQRHPMQGQRIDASSKIKSVQQHRNDLKQRNAAGIPDNKRTKPYIDEARFAQ